MTSFRERLSLSNLTNLLVRVPLATYLVHIFSQWLFSPERAEQLVLTYTKYPEIQIVGRESDDLRTLQKMLRFWPPHQGSGFGEFSLAFTVSLLLFVRLIDMPTIVHSVLGIRTRSRILHLVLTPIYASLVPFCLLFPMMRLAEMHFFVLALNFFHMLVSSFIVYFVWYFLKFDDERKEKNE